MTPPMLHLHVDAQRLFAQPPHPFVLSADSDSHVEPLIPFKPLIDRLPLQIIPGLLRAEDRLTIQWEKYRIKPHVGLHEVEIIFTRRLDS